MKYNYYDLDLEVHSNDVEKVLYCGGCRTNVFEIESNQSFLRAKVNSAINVHFDASTLPVEVHEIVTVDLLTGIVTEGPVLKDDAINYDMNFPQIHKKTDI